MKIKNGKPYERNYVNEAKWRKNHYKTRNVCLVDKDNEKLEKVLKKRNMGFSEWVKYKIKYERI